MPGWLATKCLSSTVHVKDINEFDSCVCQAVITQVNSVRSSHTIRVHVSCRGEVDGHSGQLNCQKCGITHLNEMLNKPGQLVRFKSIITFYPKILVRCTYWTFEQVLIGFPDHRSESYFAVHCDQSLKWKLLSSTFLWYYSLCCSR